MIPSSPVRFYGSAVGKKIVVALTGALLVLFLLGHSLGNLLVFEGRGETPETTKLNEYAELLRVEPAFLWGVRLVLLAAALLHVVTTVLLALQNRAARGTPYGVKKHQAAGIASRTMIYGGLLLAAFIVYHILHFTAGSVHRSLFEHGDVFSNVVRSFRNPFIAGAYLLAQVFLFLHLKHGIKSLAETLGVSHPRYVALFRRGGPALALLLAIAFSSVPLAVLLGLVA